MSKMLFNNVHMVLGKVFYFLFESKNRYACLVRDGYMVDLLFYVTI